LKDRARFAFKTNTISDELLKDVSKATSDMADIRLGIQMLLTAARSAEQRQATTINTQDIQSAMESALIVKNLTKINTLKNRIKRYRGKVIDF